MALFVGNTSVVGLGLGCQTAMQLEAYAPILEKRLGRKVRVHRTPMDWVLSGGRGIAEMITLWRFLPTDDEVHFGPKPSWPATGVRFPHHDLRAGSQTRAKFRHTTRTLERAASYARRIFIVSNTQGKFPNLEPVMGPNWHHLDEEAIIAIRRALHARFGAFELYVVGYPHTCRDIRSADGVFMLELATRKTFGDPGQWRPVLDAIIDAKPVGSGWQRLLTRVGKRLARPHHTLAPREP